MLVSLTSLRYKSLFLLVHIREVSILVCVSACVCVWCVCVYVCVCAENSLPGQGFALYEYLLLLFLSHKKKKGKTFFLMTILVSKFFANCGELQCMQG